MQVVKLFIKEKSGFPVQVRDRLTLRQGYGIEGDSNAQVGSPRQVLITDLSILAQFDLQPGQLSENILLESLSEPLVAGQILQIGTAQLWLTFLCEPCAQLNALRPGLAKQLIGRRGMLGMVIRSGTIAPGDVVRLTCDRLPALPESVKERFYQFVARIPPGRVVAIPQLLRAIGADASYARAVPAWIKKAPPSLPVHRIVTAEGNLFTRHVPDQSNLLAVEAVLLMAGKVPATFYWNPCQFYNLEE